ncbi:hypothetical protein BDR05DRAFT_962799 [Suillus weaverae]|nr:hypothetical protein BDR05DRAFT_962799 [Suillus weaverae]
MLDKQSHPSTAVGPIPWELTLMSFPEYAVACRISVLTSPHRSLFVKSSDKVIEQNAHRSPT